VSDDYEERFRRRLVEVLRSGKADAHAQDMAADELENLWWPKERKRAWRQHMEQTSLAKKSAFIQDRAEHYRKQGAKDPRTKAEQDAAARLGVSVDGLRKRVTRHRQRARS
jgi:hypothetical protein